MSYLLALDAGTGSVRAVIFDLQGNRWPGRVETPERGECAGLDGV